MFEINYEGEIWNYAFVEGGFGLNEQGNQDFVRESIRAYKGRAKRTNIKGNGFEGFTQRGKFVTVGPIGGQNYQAEVETEYGKKTVAVVVCKTLDALLN